MQPSPRLIECYPPFVLQILLLCGPPGLGKTTLAHVLARQAGYQVLEVNASDDRTGKIVEERIRNALESTALNARAGLKGNKPTCVVVDEIDGAGGGGEGVSFISYSLVSEEILLTSDNAPLELCQISDQIGAGMELVEEI